MSEKKEVTHPSPLGSVLESFKQRLTEQAYTASTQKQYLRICEQFQDYVVHEQLDVTRLDESHIEDFLQASKSCNRDLLQDGEMQQSNRRRPLRLFLDELRRTGYGVMVATPCSTANLTKPIVMAFAEFLQSHRGLSDITIDTYCKSVAALLDHTGAQTEQAIGGLSVSQIDRFLIEVAQDRARSTVNGICSGIRTFLRFAHVRGIIDKDRSAEVTLPRIYSLERLVRFLDWNDVEQTLASVDCTTLVGCRNYAILTLLARCGLRGGEVAGLRLQDIDWRHDTIHLPRRKNNSNENIPLVPTIGDALLAYVRRRPKVSFPEVFLKMLAPIGPLSRAAIGQVVKSQLKRAGINAPHWGSHTMRHSHAVQLLRQGFPLKTIGDALGHHHEESTFIYTKAAVDDLRDACLDIEEVLP
jgi:integrase/recombinase XerD